MQIEHSRPNKRRPSYINLNGIQQTITETNILSPRTPKSISKSRRGSIVIAQEAMDNNNNNISSSSSSSTTTNVRSSSNMTDSTTMATPRHTTNGQLTPNLLSDGATNSYFQENPSQVTLLSQEVLNNQQQQQQSTIRYSQNNIMNNNNNNNENMSIKLNTLQSTTIRQHQNNPFNDHPTIMSQSTSTPNHHIMNSNNNTYIRQRSSSISSIITTNGIPTPNFDVHTLYRIKTTKTSKKLDHFFGEQAPHDICIAEIKKEGLKALLQSKVPLCYFLHHLLEEYSHENLFFFIELEQYETFQYVSQVQQLATAQHIFNTYLTRNSHFEVNLDDKVRRLVTEALQNKDVNNCFDAAKRSVYSLLESSYMRFLMTDTYQLMVNNCGINTTHYDDKTRFAAVNVLIDYIEKEHSMLYTNPLTDAPVFMSVSQTAKRRHELIKSMIHEFCRTLVGVEFNYYRQDPNQSNHQHQQQHSNNNNSNNNNNNNDDDESFIPSSPPSKSKASLAKSKFGEFLKKK